eukprot:365122-Chlamydomonas_euryale.AAC.47
MHEEKPKSEPFRITPRLHHGLHFDTCAVTLPPCCHPVAKYSGMLWRPDERYRCGQPTPTRALYHAAIAVVPGACVFSGACHGFRMRRMPRCTCRPPLRAGHTYSSGGPTKNRVCREEATQARLSQTQINHLHTCSSSYSPVCKESWFQPPVLMFKVIVQRRAQALQKAVPGLQYSEGKACTADNRTLQ